MPRAKQIKATKGQKGEAAADLIIPLREARQTVHVLCTDRERGRYRMLLAQVSRDGTTPGLTDITRHVAIICGLPFDDGDKYLAHYAMSSHESVQQKLREVMSTPELKLVTI